MAKMVFHLIRGDTVLPERENEKRGRSLADWGEGRAWGREVFTGGKIGAGEVMSPGRLPLWCRGFDINCVAGEQSKR